MDVIDWPHGYRERAGLRPVPGTAVCSRVAVPATTLRQCRIPRALAQFHLPLAQSRPQDCAIRRRLSALPRDGSPRCERSCLQEHARVHSRSLPAPSAIWRPPIPEQSRSCQSFRSSPTAGRVEIHRGPDAEKISTHAFRSSGSMPASFAPAWFTIDKPAAAAISAFAVDANNSLPMQGPNCRSGPARHVTEPVADRE